MASPHYQTCRCVCGVCVCVCACVVCACVCKVCMHVRMCVRGCGEEGTLHKKEKKKKEVLSYD